MMEPPFGLRRSDREVSIRYGVSEPKSIQWSINVPEFAATMTLQVVYRAKQTELTTGERAQALAETMVAILRDSPRVKAVEIQCEDVGSVELLDDNDDLTELRIKP